MPRLRMVGVSRWYASAPVPASAQPSYVNGMVMLDGQADPASLLADLHAIEAAHGRERGAPDAARTLDLDLIAVGALIRRGADPLLPHPRAHLRAFVLRPWHDLAPGWRHPLTGRSVAEMLQDVSDQKIALIE